MLVVLKKYFVFYSCFLIWPTISNAESLRGLQEPGPISPSIPSRWRPTAIRRALDETLRANMMQMIDSEPGFDFDDEEMAKLKIWPRGVIPYYLDQISFDKVLCDRLRYYLVTVNQLSGLQFLELSKPPADNQTRWVFFINRRGILDCIPHTTHYFTNTGVQKVVLGYDCFVDAGGLAATILGLAGVPPMHTAPLRNLFIKVKMDKIIKDKQYLYAVLTDAEWLFQDLRYDFTSAGHFSWNEYSVDGSSTIQPIQQINMVAGGNRDFTYNDIWKIRMLYNYIRLKKPKMSQCKNLFEPGVNFKEYEPDSDEDRQPRSKPFEYLGKTGKLNDNDPSIKSGNKYDSQYSEEVTPNSINDSNNTIEQHNVSTKSHQNKTDKLADKQKGEEFFEDLTLTSKKGELAHKPKEQDIFKNLTLSSSKKINSSFSKKLSKGSGAGGRRWGLTTKKMKLWAKKLSRDQILQLPEFRNVHIKRKRLTTNQK